MLFIDWLLSFFFSYSVQPLLLDIDDLVNFFHELFVARFSPDGLLGGWSILTLSLLIENFHKFFVYSGDVSLPFLHIFHFNLHQLYLLLVKGLFFLMLALFGPKLLLNLEKLVISWGLDRIECVWKCIVRKFRMWRDQESFLKVLHSHVWSL